MKRRRLFKLISIAIWTSILLLGFIPFPTINTNKQSSIKTDMTKYMSVYVDSIGILTFDQLKDIHFEPYLDSGVSGSLSDAVYWIKIDLPQDLFLIDGITSNNLLLELSKPQLDYISYKQVNAYGDVLAEGELGRKFPFSQRDILYKNYIIMLEPYSGVSEVYLAVQTQSYLQVPVTLWDEDTFLETNLTYQFGNGLFYGALIIMFIYNGVLWLAIRDKNYFYLICCILSYTLLQCVWDGLSYQYLWPNSSQWDLIANPFFITTSAICLLSFTRYFLNIKHINDKLNWFYRIGIMIGIASIAALWIIPVHASVYVSTSVAFASIVLCMCSLLVPGIKRRSKYIYSIAWQFVLAGNLLNILAGLGITEYNSMIMLAPKIGIILLVSLFSFSLSEKVNQVEYQKDIETKKRIIFKNLHEVNKRITGERDIFLAFDYLLMDLLDVTGFEKGLAILINENENLLELFRCGTRNIKTVVLEQQPFELLMRNINDGMIESLDHEFNSLLIEDENVQTTKIISLVNRGRRMGFILLYSSSLQDMQPMIQEMVLEYANQFAMTIDNILLLSEITKTSQIDGLTQVYNRTYFFKTAQNMFNYTEYPTSIAALMLDIDYFKKVNDTYGHQTGDEVLKRTADMIKCTLGSRGIVGRYGGEEFIIAVFNQPHERVVEIAQNIRKEIEETQIKIDAKSQLALNITISIGVSYTLSHIKTFFSLTEEADKALYKAKNQGRNQVVTNFE